MLEPLTYFAPVEEMSLPSVRPLKHAVRSFVERIEADDMRL